MGIAAYNRGSKMLSERLDREQRLPARPERTDRPKAEQKRPEWAVGDWAYCTVHAIRGWYRVTDVRQRDGYFKVDAFRTWNPPHNFTHMDPMGKTYAD